MISFTLTELSEPSGERTPLTIDIVHRADYIQAGLESQFFAPFNNNGGIMMRFVLVGMLALALTAQVFADAKPGGIARQISMGGSSAGFGLALNPYIYDDPALILLNPAFVARYKDYAWWNVGGGTLNGLSTNDNGYNRQNVGLNFGVTNNVAVGAVFSYDPSVGNALTQLPAQAALAGIYQRAPQTVSPMANVWELLGTFDLGTIDLGLGVMYGGSSVTSESSVGGTSGKSEASLSMFGVRGGVIFDLGSGSMVDGSVTFRSSSLTDEITNAGKYTASATEIMVGVRAKLRVSNKFSFVPYGTYMMVSAEPKEDSPPTGGTATTSKLDLSATILALGVGGEYRAGDLFLAGGVGFNMADAKLEFSNSATPAANFDSTMSYLGIPVINLGAEWWFTEWLAGRMGYFRSIGSATLKGEHDNATFEQSFSAPYSQLLINNPMGLASDGSLVTLGIGLRFGNFALDATVSEEALRRGLGIIGAQDNINTFGFITTSYNIE
jgi:hypothetical protein